MNPIFPFMEGSTRVALPFSPVDTGRGGGFCGAQRTSLLRGGRAIILKQARSPA